MIIYYDLSMKLLGSAFARCHFFFNMNKKKIKLEFFLNAVFAYFLVCVFVFCGKHSLE